MTKRKDLHWLLWFQERERFDHLCYEIDHSGFWSLFFLKWYYNIDNKGDSKVYQYLAKQIGKCVTKESDQDEKQIVYYGLELLLSTWVTTIILFVLGIVFDCFFETICFILFYCTLRQYAGGYHSDTYLKCNLFMSSCYLVILIIDRIITFQYSWLLAGIFAIFVIFYFAPVMNQNKRLSEGEVRYYKKSTYLIASIEVIVATFLLIIHQNRLLKFAIFAFCLVALFLILGYIKYERRGST